MKKYFNILLVLLFTLLVSALAFAQETVPVELPIDQFVAQVFELIKGFGGLSWAGKISGILLLLIASMKVSFLRPLWDRLGKAKSWAAPVLGALLGIVSLSFQGQLTLKGVFAYLFAGAGAVLISELLELVKGIPGIGPMWLRVIDWLKSILGAPRIVK